MGSYKNVMELLVEEEVTKQLKPLPPKVLSYVNPVELVAYALNQLPSLYATSEKGLEYQVRRGRSKYGSQISQAVQRAIAAVRRDPIRNCIPLELPQQSVPLREVLHQLRLILKNDKIEWDTLPLAVEEVLARYQQRLGVEEVSHETQGYAQVHSSRYARREFTSPSRQPETGSGSTSKPAYRRTNPNVQQNPNHTPEYGWDNPLYK